MAKQGKPEEIGVVHSIIVKNYFINGIISYYHDNNVVFYFFTEYLISIANQSIPKFSTSSKRIKKPWFTDECEIAIKDRKKAERLFNKTPTLVNLNNFRIAQAKARRTVNQSKRKSWKNYVSNINMHTPILNKVWNIIRTRCVCLTQCPR